MDEREEGEESMHVRIVVVVEVVVEEGGELGVEKFCVFVHVIDTQIAREGRKTGPISEKEKRKKKK